MCVPNFSSAFPLINPHIVGLVFLILSLHIFKAVVNSSLYIAGMRCRLTYNFIPQLLPVLNCIFEFTLFSTGSAWLPNFSHILCLNSKGLTSLD